MPAGGGGGGAPKAEDTLKSFVGRAGAGIQKAREGPAGDEALRSRNRLQAETGWREGGKRTLLMWVAS